VAKLEIKWQAITRPGYGAIRYSDSFRPPSRS
jgi:hypothetical protein